MTHGRRIIALAIIFLLSGLMLLMQSPANAHNYFAFLFNYAGFAQNPEQLAPMPPASATEIDRLLEQLKSQDKMTRWMAAGALGQTGSTRAVEPLLNALKDTDMMVRASAALSLGMLKDKRAVEPLKSIMASKDESHTFTRMTAPIALSMLGVGDIEAISYLGQDTLIDEATQAQVLDALLCGKKPAAAKLLLDAIGSERAPESVEYHMLCEIADESCREVLLEALEKGAPSVKCAAACALTDIEPAHAADALIAIIADRSFKNRYIAVQYLAEMKDVRAFDILVNLLKDRDEEVSSSAVYALGDMDDPKVMPILLSLLNNAKDPNWEVVTHVFAERKEKAAVDALITMLKDKDLYRAGKAADTLREIGDRRAIEPLLAVLNRKDDPNQELRPSVCTALAYLGDPRAIQPIITTYSNDPSSAANDLGRLKHPESAEALFGLLRIQKTDEGLVSSVNQSLSYIGKAAIEPAIEALQDANPAVRAAAVLIFTVYKDPRSVSGLIPRLADKNVNVRADAALALSIQEDKQATPKLQAALKDTSAKVRAQAALALGALQDIDSREALAAMLTDKSSAVRMSAGLALCELGDERGIPQILRLTAEAKDGDPPSVDYLRVIKACGKLKDKRTIGLVLDTIFYNLVAINQSTVDPEPDQDLIQSPVDALTAITGQNFGHAYYRWMAWGIAEANWKPTPIISLDEEEQ